jgi:hypothetical protein
MMVLERATLTLANSHRSQQWRAFGAHGGIPRRFVIQESNRINHQIGMVFT